MTCGLDHDVERQVHHRIETAARNGLSGIKCESRFLHRVAQANLLRRETLLLRGGAGRLRRHIDNDSRRDPANEPGLRQKALSESPATNRHVPMGVWRP